MSLKRGRKFKKLFTALVVGGSFLFLLSAEKALASATSTYAKEPSGTLFSSDWNSLLGYNTTTELALGDFVNTWLPARMEGPLGIATSAPALIGGNTLEVDGNIQGSSFVYGSLAADRVTSGSFGSKYGGGNYSFPGNLGIGTINPVVKTVIQQGGTTYAQVGDTGTWDMALGIKADTGKITGMDFYNQNGSGQVRLMARNDQSDYVVMNMPSSGSGATWFGLPTGNASYLWSYGATDTDKKLAIGTINAGDLVFGTNGAERARILSTGNFGIGISSPAQKLDVSGSMRITGAEIKGDSEYIGSWKSLSLEPATNIAYLNIGSFNNSFEHFNLDIDLAAGWYYSNNTMGYLTKSFTVRMVSGAIGWAHGNITKDEGSISNIFSIGSPEVVGGVLRVPIKLLNGYSGTRDYVSVRMRLVRQLGSPLSAITDTLSAAESGIGGTREYLSFGNNVGIGTTTPLHKLHVNGNVQLGTAFNYSPLGSLDFIVGSPNSNSRFMFGQSNSVYGGMVWNYNSTTANTYLSIGIANTGGSTVLDGINIKYNGSVGIGTTSPSSKLTLSGGDFEMDNGKSIKISSSTAHTTLLLGNYADGLTSPSFYYGTSTQATNKTASLALEGDLKADRLCIEEDCKAAWSEIVSAGGGGTWVLNGSNLYASSTSWNVGIGTSSPQSKLHIVKDGSALRIEGSAGGTRYYDIGRALTGVTSSAYLGFDAAEGAGAGYQFMISGSPKLTLLGGGNVGIGTTTPTAVLEVKADGNKDILKLVNSAGNTAFQIDNNTLNAKFWPGSGATPGISFVNDTNTGFQGGGDILGFLTGGVRQMTILGNGNVGIGTTAPNDTFSIGYSGSAAPADDIGTGHNFVLPDGSDNYALVNVGYLNTTVNALSSTSSANAWLKGGNMASATSTIGTLDAYDFPIIASGTEVMRITKGGNIGIGTTNPGYKLDIQDAALRIGETYENTGLRTVNTLKTGEFVVPSYANGKDVVVFRMVTNNTANTLSFGGGTSVYDSPTAVSFYTGATPTTTGTEKMRIDASGNVGIGTTAPATKLHVAGGARFESTTTLNDGTERLRLSWGLSPLGAIVQAGSGMGMYLGVNNSATTGIFINSSGNVGIGTTAPTEKLEVYAANSAMAFTRSASTGSARFHYKTGSSYLWSTGLRANRDDFTIFDEGTSNERLTILKSNGNVGIGTTAPNDTFSIGYGGSEAPAGILGSGHNFVTILDGSDDYALANVGYVDAAFDAISEGWSLGGNTLSQTELFGTSNAYDLPFITNNSERMRIKSGGKIGIGTADPGSALHVMSNQQSVAQFTSDYLAGNQSGYIGNGTYFSGVEFGLYYLSAGPDIPLAVYDTDSSLSLYGGGLSVDISGADTSGNVGIGTGTSTPTDKLDVKGPIYLQPSAPVATANRLYNSGGNLFWNGTQLGAGSTAGDFWSLSSSNLYASSTSWNLIVGTTTTATSSKIWTDGTIHASSFVYGSLPAANVTPGAFAYNYGNSGNYSFPGNLGIGTSTPRDKLEVNGNIVLSDYVNGKIVWNNWPASWFLSSNTWQNNDPAGLTLRNTRSDAANAIKFVTASSTAMVITATSNVGIGTTDPGIYKLKVAGDVVITGTLLTQTGSDFAEEFKAPSALEAGTVVVMGDAGYKSVKACENNYDKKVVGIVSDNASIIAGRTDIDKKNPEKVIVAMMGVVKVKVTALNGGISKGDLLTTSNLKGYAMKATKNKQGTIIGKALEDLNGEKGEVKVLVNLQ